MRTMTNPHQDNFCGGNYQDWLEVMLLPECNGKCEWCIEKTGWHPKEKAPWTEIVKAAEATGRKNIILLGGEPTIYPALGSVINYLHHVAKCKVYTTTNGFRLNREYVHDSLRFLTGINISIHSYNLDLNYEITGIKLKTDQLKEAIQILKSSGCKVRFNCNLIKGHIDSQLTILDYIDFARYMDADSVRFAELKNDEDNFVDLHKIWGDKYGLNDDPYLKGCNKNVEIDGMHVNFRQMCGLQTPLRPQHPMLKEYPKQVLYYDGKIYDGWQIMKEHKGKYMDYVKLIEILEAFKNDSCDINETIDKIKECADGKEPVAKVSVKEVEKYSGGCVY